MSNPYEPQKTRQLDERPISQQLIEQMLRAHGTTDLVDKGFANQRLWGKWYRRKLTGEFATMASKQGLDLEVYQAVDWFAFYGIPLSYRGTYLVIPYVMYEHDPDDRFRVLRTSDCPAQIFLYRSLGIFKLLLILGIFVGPSISDWLLR